MTRPQQQRIRGRLGAVARGAAALVAGLYLVGRWQYTIDPTFEPVRPAMPTPNAFVFAALAGERLQAERELSNRDASAFAIPEARRLVAKHAASLALYRAGRAYPWRNPPVTSLATTMPYLAQFRQLTVLLVLESRVRAADGDRRGALESVLDGLRLALEIPRGGPLVCCNSGRRCEAVACRRLWELADGLTAAEAKRVARRMESLDSARVPFAETLANERDCTLAVVLEMYHWPGPALPLGACLRAEHAPDAPGLLAWFVHRRRSFRRLERLHDRAIIAAGAPDSGLAEFRQSLYRETWDLMSRDIVAHTMLSPSHASPLRFLLRRANTRLLFTDLALRAYRLEHGRAAPNLEALVAAGYLQRVPLDPFSGRPLRYADGRLWSIGPDAADDGGRAIVTKGSLDSLPPDARGDLVAGVNRR